MSTEPRRGAPLDIADLATVHNDTFPCRAKWYNLGVQLQVDVGTLDCFKVQYDDPGDQLREVLRTWLTSSDNPTWQAMVQALNSPVIREVRLAKELQKRELRKEYSSRQPPVDVPLRRKALKMQAQVRTLQDNFADIATRASAQIRTKHIDAQDFRVKFMMQMDVSQRHENHQFIQCCLKRLEPGTTIDDLLVDLSMYWDFFNYGLLEHTIYIFGDPSLKQDMKGYVDKLRTFRVNTKLCDFIDNWPVRGQDPPKADFKHVVIKMRKKWEECTLEDIENFRETLTHKFFLPNFVLLLREAEKGCICLTWYTPAPIANTIQENLSRIETEFFDTHGIQRVSVSGQECYITPVEKSTADLKGIAFLHIESSVAEYGPLPSSPGEIKGIEQLPVVHAMPLYISESTGRTREKVLLTASTKTTATADGVPLEHIPAVSSPPPPSTTVATGLGTMPRIDSIPRLAELVTLKTRKGERVNIIESLAPQWKQFGVYLDFDHTGRHLDLIEAEHAHEPHRVVACCQEMFKHWLKGNGVQPVTWRTLIELLDHCNEIFLVEQIEDALKLN